MRRGKLLSGAAALLGVAGLLVAGTQLESDASAHQVPPADTSLSQPARQVLDWLAHLPNRDGANRVASGYFAGYSGPELESTRQEIETVRTKTGQYPAVIACDYASGWDGAASPSPTTIDTSCNGYLKDAWANGSLVSVSVHMPNPGGGPLAQQKLADFATLTDRSTPLGQAWYAWLDQVAAGLRDLSDAGVPVLFRPFHEMNLNWFWWGDQDPAVFRAVWQHMFRYVGGKLGTARNVLWVYAPQCNYGRYGADGYYPGDGYADVVGLDCYTDDPATLRGYEEMLALKKPFAFTEIGPPNVSGAPVPGYDYAKWASALHGRFPEASYFQTWNSLWSPVNNGHLHGSELFNDSWVANRGEVNLGTQTESSRVVLAGFESGAQGWTSWSTLDGPWPVTEWAWQGARSFKADVDLARGEAFLNSQAAYDLTGRTRLQITARAAPWGNQAAGTQAKLYVRVGPDKTWYDGGPVTVGPDGAVLGLDLTRIPNRADIREIGVTFTPAPGATSRSAVYIDELTAR